MIDQRKVSSLPGWVSMKNLNLNIFMLQKKASLPEFIKGSYMVVLTFESACRWNTMVTIQINFFRQYFNLVRFGFLHLILQNEDRKSCPIDFGNFWEWKVYITHHFFYEIVCSIYVCLTEAQDSSTKNTIYSVLKKIQLLANSRLLRNTITPL